MVRNHKKVHNSLEEINKLPHEVLEVKSSDGLTMRGIYYPAAEKSDKTVICIHGYSSHAEREWAFPGLFYHSIGFNVLIPYQRAHGLSEGKKITFGVLEVFDMIQWIHKTNEKTPNGKILIHGLSMGGGIALELADLSEIHCIKGIISTTFHAKFLEQPVIWLPSVLSRILINIPGFMRTLTTL